MALNLNINPYYDDFDADKNFQRILFKPGYAVQARELTQIQTILQEQVKRFGDNIFKPGAVIAGCDYALNLNVPYVKILDTGAGATNTGFADYAGETLVGATSGVTALIKKATPGTVTSIHKTFHVQYNDQGSAGIAKTFAADEVLHFQSNAGTVFTVAGSGTTPIGTGSLFSLKNGVIYGKGTFVLHHDQTIVLDAFSSTPTKSVGINIVEETVTSSTDLSLLDPASGAYNFAAPGADRLKMTTQLVAFNTTDALSEEFNTLFDIIAGNVARRYDLNPYGAINKTLASRTYDESGDYTTKDFNFNVRENKDNGTNGGLSTFGSADLLSLGITPGKAYVKGYEYETYSTIYLDVNKETATRDLTSNVVSTTLGNYILVKEVCGPVTLNAGTIVSLRSLAAAAITAGTYSATSAPGSEIGKARVQSIEYDSGTMGAATCQYRLYLYDIQMSSGAFSDVNGIYYDGTADFHADVLDTTAILQDTSYNSLLFSLPKRYIKTLDVGVGGYSNSFVYRKTMTATVLTSGTSSGTFTLSLSGKETWAFSTASSVTRNNDILVVANAAMLVSSSAIYKIGQIIPLGAAVGATTGAVTVTDSTHLTFDLTTSTLDAESSVTVTVSVRVTDTAPRVKALNKGRKIRLQVSKTFTTSSNITTSPSTTSFIVTALTAGDAAVGDIVYKSSDNTVIGTVTSVTPGTLTIGITTATSTLASGGTVSIAHPNYNVVSGVLNAPLSLGLYDVIKINSVKSASSTVAWTGITTDVTDKFLLNTGQTDTLYDIASISKKAKETFTFLDTRLIVDVDWFEHTATTGYFSVDSYPLPAQGSAATSTQIEWYELPQYVSPNGNKVNLRDVLDFRPTVTAVATDTITVTSATVNPVAYTMANKTFLATIYTPNSQEEFTTNVRYNVGRIDRVVIDSDGDFKDIAGVADITPIAPQEPGNVMTLAFVTIPPFPALSPKVARAILRPEMSATTTLVDNRRYTMRDIGSIDKKLDNLKKFTEVSFLEQKLLNTSLPNTSGQERPKTGILVDDFLDHSNGNTTDPSYNCTIFSGILQPSLNARDVQFDVATLSNVVRASSDAIIVVEQPLSGKEYIVNENVTNSSLTGTIKHIVTLASNASYRWVRLYLEQVTGTGTFAIANTIIGNNTTTGTIPTSSSTVNISATLFPLILRPDAVVTPSAGNIATLPYTHSDFVHNPNASEAINTVSSLLFNYDGHITLTPYSDVWFDESNQPEGNNFTLPTSGDTSWFSAIAPPVIAGVTASTPTVTGGTTGSSGVTTPPSYGGGTSSLGGGSSGGTTGTKELDGGITGPYNTEIYQS